MDILLVVDKRCTIRLSTVKKSAILEIKRDEWLLLRDAKAQNLHLTTKPLEGTKNKGIVTAGVKYSIALSVWINPFE